MSLRHRSTTTRFRGCCGPSAATKQPSNSGLGRLAFITIAVFLTALSSSRLSSAQGKQPCSAAMPSKVQGQWWSYRIIDGRKCWYEGKPGMAKSLLEWPAETAALASTEAVTSIVPEKPRKRPDSRARAPSSEGEAPSPQARAPTDPDTFETRWHAGAFIETQALPEEAAPAMEAGPATPAVDDGLPLAKADRLPLIEDRKK